MNAVQADFSKYRFLVADDSNHIRRLVCGMLLRCKPKEVHQAGDGAEALQILKNYPGEIHCVLCDWNMEPMNGLALLNIIRSGAHAKISRNVHFIMLTGHSQINLVQAASDSDVSGFLTKPVSMDRLVKTVISVMAKEQKVRAPEHYMKADEVPLPDSDLRRMYVTGGRG